MKLFPVFAEYKVHQHIGNNRRVFSLEWPQQFHQLIYFFMAVRKMIDFPVDHYAIYYALLQTFEIAWLEYVTPQVAHQDVGIVG